MYCRNCGNQIAPNQAFCPHCGAAMARRVVVKQKPIRPMAGFIVSAVAIFAMIFGLTGIVGFVGFVISIGEILRNGKNKKAMLEFSAAGAVLGGVITLLFIVSVILTAANVMWTQVYLG